MQAKEQYDERLKQEKDADLSKLKLCGICCIGTLQQECVGKFTLALRQFLEPEFLRLHTYLRTEKME